MKNTTTSLTLLSLLISSHGLANEQDIFELSLEELLDVNVSVASRNKVKQSDAPGMVTVYHEEEIKKYNYYTLRELAAITPGFSSANIYAGQSNFMVRGQKVEGFDNNKVLVLLDGIPVNHLRDDRAPMDEDISLVGVQKVEFLKGPASALYGTSAFFGVINIVTKEVKEGESYGAGQFYYGSFDKKGGRVFNVSHKNGVKTKIRAAINHQNPTGNIYGYKSGTRDYQTEKTKLNHGFDRAEDYHVDGSFKLEKGALKGLSLGMFLTQNSHGTFENDDNFNAYTYKFRTTSLYLKYEKEFSEKFKTNTHIRQTESLEEGLRYVYSYVFKGYSGAVDTEFKVSDKSDFHFGVSFDTRKQENYEGGTVLADSGGENDFVEKGSKSLETYSAFMQYNTELDIHRGLLVVTGLRYDKSKSQFSDSDDISPRLALVQRLSPNLNIKFLYGKALRAPDLKSTLINAGVVEEGADLKQEKLKGETADSYELGLSYANSRVTSNLTAFYMVIKDAINRRSFDGKDSYRNDTGKTKSQGLEFDLKYIHSPNLDLFTNITYAKARLPNVEDDSDLNGQEVGGTPTYTFNLGTSYKLNDHKLSFIGKYIDAFRVADETEKHEGFAIFDVNYVYNYMNDLDIGLKITNLFDEDARVPNFQEQYFSQSFLGHISYKF